MRKTSVSCGLQRLEVRGKLGSKTFYSAHSWKSYPKYFVLYLIISKNYHLSCDFHLNCNFQSLNHHWSVLLDQIPLQLDRKGIKESEDGMRGGEGGDYFRYFRQKGAIIWGRQLLEGLLLFREIWYFKSNTTPALLFLMLILMSVLFWKVTQTTQLFPFCFLASCFPLMLDINWGFILVKQALLSETRFPYLLENKPFVFVSIVFELCVKAFIN